MARGFVLRDCRCDQGRAHYEKLVRRKTIIRTILAVAVPQLADWRMVKEEAHSFFPRLPDRVVDISGLVEEILFRTKIEIAEKKISIGFREVIVGRAESDTIQPFV